MEGDSPQHWLESPGVGWDVWGWGGPCPPSLQSRRHWGKTASFLPPGLPAEGLNRIRLRPAYPLLPSHRLLPCSLLCTKKGSWGRS